MLKTSFPVGESISGVFLKEVKCNLDPLGIKFTFIKGNSTISNLLVLPVRKNFKDQSDMYKESMRVTLWMESVFFTFLSADQILGAKQDLSGDIEERLCMYLENINKLLTEVNAFSEPICLQVVEYNGKPMLPKYVSYGNRFYPFIKKESDITKELKFKNKDYGVKN